jgi:hypothetical protein
MADRVKRLNVIKRQLQSAQAKAAILMWEVGSLFLEVEREELWREDGSPNMSSWLDSLEGYSRRSARRAMQMASHFSLESARVFGSEKLLATLVWMDATRRDEQPGDLLALRIRVREPNGMFNSVAYADATADQILAAARLLREQNKEGKLAEIDRTLEERVEEAIADLPPPPRGLFRGPRVQVRRTGDGAVGLTVHGVPPEKLDAVLALLREG